MDKLSATYLLVEHEVRALLEHKSLEELQLLRNDILYRLDINDNTIDKEFMRSVLVQISHSRSFKQNVHDSVSGKAKEAHLVSDLTTIEKRMLEEQIRRGLEEDEQVLKSNGLEFNRPERSRYSSDPSVLPRIPKFYNTIKSGIVWNKYAQTHFDEDNPPPKQVLGYKFNIFYPDLKDASRAPRYKLEKCDASDQHVLLRFMAGSPYEDVVFSILNKEWDLDRRSGFMCQFERGMLQLHFSFKRDRYRR